MFKPLAKTTPYLLLAVCVILTIIPISQAIWGPRTAVELSCSQIELTEISKLPGWVVVKDAKILWPESITHYKDIGGVRIPEHLFVPVVSDESQQTWGEFKEGRQTLLVAEIPFSELKSKYPKLAAAASGSGTELANSDFPRFDSLNFNLAGRRVSVDGKIKDAMNLWITQNGFKEHVLVPFDKTPPSIGDSVAMACFFTLCSAGCVAYIRRRRRKALMEAGANGYMGGMASAISQAIAEGMMSAKSKAEVKTGGPSKSTEKEPIQSD
jgi:hypothetical protein